MRAQPRTFELEWTPTSSTGSICCVRWLHLIAGIAWIGASFYFVMLDNSLSPPEKAADRERGVFGELWAVHGGGFYVSQKFLTGPKGEPLSDNLHWSKWEAYTTWLSGMGLLAIIYWFGASTWLIDRSVLDISPGAGHRDQHRRHRRRLARLRRTVPAAARPGEPARGARVRVRRRDVLGARPRLQRARRLLHVGVMLGTIMVANVFFVIIPGQKAMVADILRRAGARSGAGHRRQAALGAQHLLHAAGAVRDDQQPLSDDLRASVRLGGACAGDAGRRADPAVSSCCGTRASAKAWLPIAACVLLAGVAVGDRAERRQAGGRPSRSRRCKA